MMAKMVDRVKTAMKKETHIRNLAIAAHIDHGKCVRGDTRLQLTDGSFVTAEDLFKAVSEEGTLVRNDGDVVYEPKENLNVFSLNKEHGSLEHKKIEYAWKLEGGKLIRTKLRSGAEISTTPEHRYIVLEDMEFVEKEAEDLRIGDRVVCARSLVVEDKEDIRAEILERLSKNTFYVRIDGALAETMKENIIRDGMDTVETELKEKSFYHGMWQNRYRLIDAVNLCERYGIDLSILYENISLYYMVPGGKASIRITMPSRVEDLFCLAGLLVGYGSGNKFVVGKEQLGEEFKRICSELGFTPAERRYEGKTPELCTNRTVLEILKILFDYPTRKKSHNVKVSRFLSTAPRPCVASFLRAYFDCDGTIETGRSAVSLTSVSPQMLHDLQLLLLRFGAVSIVQGNTIYLSGESAKEFEKKIGFTVKDKVERTRKLTEKSVGSYALDTVPVSHEKMEGFRKVPMARLGHHYYKYEKQVLTPTVGTFNAVKQRVSDVQGQVLELERLSKGDLAYIEVVSLEEDHADTVYDFTIKDNHNFVAEGMVIHNTTFSDNLLAGAGMMSEDLAGSARVLDFHEDEAERGITIDSAAVSMVHRYDDEDYLINLIDTPGHVDFGGDVTRAMRAVDGCIVLVCAVEGMMPQTETVLRQALRERVKPILFINKVDRLIKELKLSPEGMQERFVNIISEVNRKIKQIAEKEYYEKFLVNVNDGSVCMGSAFHNWALSVPYMQRSGLSFTDIIKAYEGESDAHKELRKKAPIHEVILNAVIRHHPSPKTAAGYRVPKIWHGDLDSPLGKGLQNCDPAGPLAFVVTKVVVDPQAGEICAGRLFSGTMKRGVEAYLNRARQEQRIQQVYIYNGAKKEIVDDVPAGNIIGVGGLRNAFPGETVTLQPDEPFDQITHIFEPVITKAIEAKKPSDLPKLVEVLMQVGKEDPSIKVEINQETGEHLISGMGELHLEIVENRIKTEKNVEIETSPPVVVYRETVTKKSPQAEGKSPNKHNRVYFTVEPVTDEMMEALKQDKIPKGRVKKKDNDLWDALKEAGMDTKDARNVRNVFNDCILIDDTKGEVYMQEVIELINDMFEDVMSKGPLANEPSFGVLVRLADVKLHEDAIHRGPAQMYPAVRDGIRGAMMHAGPVMYEPVQTLRFEAPVEHTGDISKLISNKRGQLLDMQQEGAVTIVLGKLPVGEMFGMSSELRSATGGRGSSSLVDQNFEKLPHELQAKIINEIRSRKGLKSEE